MMDSDLAEMYGVQTRSLNQAVKRNLSRFPSDFMFQLTKEEKTELITNCDRLSNLKHSTSLPYAFPEHGALMLASVLNSERAISMSIMVVRAFVKLRELMRDHKELAIKIAKLEANDMKQDKQLREIYYAIQQLMAPPEKPKRPIGFQVEKRKSK